MNSLEAIQFIDVLTADERKRMITFFRSPYFFPKKADKKNFPLLDFYEKIARRFDQIKGKASRRLTDLEIDQLIHSAPLNESKSAQRKNLVKAIKRFLVVETQNIHEIKNRVYLANVLSERGISESFLQEYSNYVATHQPHHLSYWRYKYWMEEHNYQIKLQVALADQNTPKVYWQCLQDFKVYSLIFRLRACLTLKNIERGRQINNLKEVFHFEIENTIKDSESFMADKEQGEIPILFQLYYFLLKLLHTQTPTEVNLYPKIKKYFLENLILLEEVKNATDHPDQKEKLIVLKHLINYCNEQANRPNFSSDWASIKTSTFWFELLDWYKFQEENQFLVLPNRQITYAVYLSTLWTAHRCQDFKFAEAFASNYSHAIPDKFRDEISLLTQLSKAFYQENFSTTDSLLAEYSRNADISSIRSPGIKITWHIIKAKAFFELMKIAMHKDDPYLSGTIKKTLKNLQQVMLKEYKERGLIAGFLFEAISNFCDTLGKLTQIFQKCYDVNPKAQDLQPLRTQMSSFSYLADWEWLARQWAYLDKLNKEI